MARARLLLAAGVLGGVVLSGHRAGGGLPGYAEWVLWKATETAAPTEQPGGSQVEFEWVLGPYPRLLDCELARDHEGDRLTRGSAARPAGIARIRLLCVPDWVDPRRDRRWQ